MMTGQLPSRIGAYDNAAELNAGVPTFAHYLRALGYRTCLSGKMDFTGADQLHGYEERLTTDLSPSDFGWTPEWEQPEKLQPWFHDLASVVDAGPYDHSLAMAYDEEAAGQAVRWLYETAGGTDERPFLLTVSFMHPHDPYLARREFWDLYDDDGDRSAAGALHRAGGARSAQPPPPRHVRPRRVRHHGRAHPAGAARLLRHDQLHRCAARPHSRGAGGARAARRYRDHRHRRPWRHAGRARALVQDDVLRARGAGAADPLRAGAVRGAARGAGRVAGRSAADAVGHRRTQRARCDCRRRSMARACCR